MEAFGSNSTANELCTLLRLNQLHVQVSIRQDV